MNYTIIKHEEELQKFINWLPDLKNGEKFYVSLFGRKKYVPNSNLKSDKAQLKRFVTDKERLIDKLRKLEVKEGSYQVDGISIPQEALAVYISPNPRCMRKASIRTAQEILKNIEQNKYQNPQSIALNQIQVSYSKKVYFDLDIDSDSHINTQELGQFFHNKINPEAFGDNIVKTRGGYHVLIELDKISEQYKKSWYNNLSKPHNYSFTVTMNGDNLIPIPGCVQGNFVPLMY